MGNPCVCKPGEIVQLAGIDFMVLEDLTPFNGDGDEHDLFVLAVDSQGTSRFGDANNYAESDLRKATEKWLTEKLYDHGCNPDYIKSRKLDLTTLEGYKGYGELDVKAAPLTLDEARRCAELMPNPDTASWLATGWEGPNNGATYALGVSTNGGWGYGNCSYAGYAIRPALVVSSFLFTSIELDLSKVPTEDLLGELRRRIGEE